MKPLKKIDGYLSRLAQQIDPTALVGCDEEGEWFLQRSDHEILGFGDNFSLANQSLRAWINAEKNRGKK